MPIIGIYIIIFEVENLGFKYTIYENFIMLISKYGV